MVIRRSHDHIPSRIFTSFRVGSTMETWLNQLHLYRICFHKVTAADLDGLPIFVSRIIRHSMDLAKLPRQSNFIQLPLQMTTLPAQLTILNYCALESMQRRH